MVQRLIEWFRRSSKRTSSSGIVAPLRRVFVDLSTIVQGDSGTGIQRVVKSICQELSGEDWPEVEIVAVAGTRRMPYRIVETPLLRSKVAASESPLILEAGDLFLGLDLAAHVLSSHEWQLRRWKENGASIAIVIYDLLPLLRPEWFNSRLVKSFNRWLRVIGRHADLLLPISRSVLADTQRFMAQWHPERAAVVRLRRFPLSGDIGLHDTQGELAAIQGTLRAMRQRSAILMVGTVEPRKGHAAALAAHRLNWREASPTASLLVIAGQKGWKTEALQSELAELDLERDGAIWLGRVNDAELDALYRACAGVLVASYGEGYCLPLHEALAYARPALARNLPVLRELEADGVAYFDGDDAVTLAKAMTSFISDRGTEIARCEKGWDESMAVLKAELTAPYKQLARPPSTSADFDVQSVLVAALPR